MSANERIAIAVGEMVAKLRDTEQSIIRKTGRSRADISISDFTIDTNNQSQYYLCHSKYIPDELKLNYKPLVERYQTYLDKTLKLSDAAIKSGFKVCNKESVYNKTEKLLVIDIFISQTTMKNSKYTDKLQRYLEDRGVDIFGLMHEQFHSANNSRYSRRTIEYLELLFETNPRPNSSERLYIAKQSGLSAKQVRIWFTNRRARVKPFKNQHY